jgi:hypothetical protein
MFTVFTDGVAVPGTLQVQAICTMGQVQTIDMSGSMATGGHVVEADLR